MNKPTSNIAKLKEMGFTVEKTPEDVAIGCVGVKHADPFYYVNNRHLQELQQVVNTYADFSEFVSNSKQGMLIFPESSMTATDIPFTILSKEQYTEIVHQIHEIEQLNEQINNLKQHLQKYKDNIFVTFNR